MKTGRLARPFLIKKHTRQHTDIALELKQDTTVRRARMKKKIIIVLAGILFLAVALLLYPLVANQWNNYRQSRLISEYESVVKDESRKGTINYEKEWERANA
mgnify:CR=1 FL=1